MAAMVVLLLLGLLQLAVPGLAQIPPSGTVKIENSTYAGSGCPPGSNKILLVQDGQAVIVMFSKYRALTPGTPDDRRTNCQVAISLSFPTGFMFTLRNVTFRGYSQFGEGVNGSLAASCYSSEIEGTVGPLRNLPTQEEGDFTFTEESPSFIYPKCNSTSVVINIDSEASVVPPPPPGNNNQGLIGFYSLSFGLSWQSC
ncbi:hypothetical protein CBR_g25798 [Chara braunii]|uniref:DUF4360 domain-containing protein n=1 Tax=Chara braunii TaxID=69332 RepID=A0A388L6D4_CHABU|nr:hypothetical protein CBR_g25798 [Chara braunii]|eukprot:GBG77866.1 hypothetical protein CBR_g25798 [Chara braunii]